MSFPFFGRTDEFDLLNKFLKTKGSGFAYVRGRRRVGKSLLLKEFQKKNSHSCYFMGKADANDLATRLNFAEQWSSFDHKSRLKDIRQERVSWKVVFDEISTYAAQTNKDLLLIFDEIQWLSKKGSGFAGHLKEAWQSWQRNGRVKVIVCGSSNKFFKSYAEGDEKILRGLRTFGDIWVKPFTLAEAQKYYFPNWNLEEICLAYMMFGGCPYYLERVDPHQGFVLGINDAVFTQQGIFLNEIDEILNLDFNKKGVQTIKKILSVLGQQGTHQAGIINKTGLSQSVVAEALAKLTEYSLVFENYPLHKKPKGNESGVVYFMKDFFLNFYFQVIEPYSSRISVNVQGNLFGQKCLSSKTGYYISDFTGKAFELLVRDVLENRANMKPRIFSKLDLRDVDYEVGTYHDKETQIDLVVEDNSDRLSRLIECKWVGGDSTNTNQLIDASIKPYTPPKNFKMKHFLVTSHKLSTAAEQYAQQKGVALVSLEALF